MGRFVALRALQPRWWAAHPLYAAAVALVLAGTVAEAWYLASPLFIRTRLEEQSGIGTGNVVARGSFGDRDAVHRGTGTVSLVQDGGRAVLRLDQFRVTNGPDLYVYLTSAAAPTSHDEVAQGLRVGQLKASEGTFSYALPAGTDLRTFRAAVIYCYQFRTIFSVAPLAT